MRGSMVPTGKRRATVLIASGVLLVGVSAALARFAHAATGLTASYVVTDDWGTGYAATYTIRNGATTNVTGWKLEFDLPSTTSVRKYWTASMTHSGTHWVFTNLSYNATVAAGGSQSFGFNTNGEGKPSNCLINGVPCSGAVPSPSPSTTVSPSRTPSPSPSTSTPPVSPYTRVAVSGVTASSNSAARNAIDSRLDTTWWASGDGQSLAIDIGTTLTVGLVDVAFQNGDTRQYRFDIQVSNDNTTWTTIWSGNSSGTGTAPQTFDVPDTSARY